MSDYNIEEVNKELWDICEDFKMQTNINNNYLDYISALLYIIYYRNDNLRILEELYSKRKNYYIGENIDSLIQQIRQENKDLFYDVKFKKIKTYRNIGEENILSKIIDRIYNLIISIQNRYSENKRYISEAYKYVVIQAMSNTSITMRNGEVYTPTGIAKTMVGCLNMRKGVLQVADPYCGTGNILLNIPQEKQTMIFGKEENSIAYNICMTNLMLADYENKYIEFNNFEETNYLEKKYDYILSNPPFIERNIKTKTIHNQKISYSYGGISLAPGDYAYVLSMLDTLKQDGKMAVILPHGVLFRETEKRVREFLIRNNNIEAIIGLPGNMFFGTRISVIIMILSKNKKDNNVVFIDASKEFKSKRKINILEKKHQNKIINTYLEKKEILEYSHIADIKEIIENDYDLTIKKYIRKKEKKEKVKREDLIEKLDVLERERNILEENIKDVLEKLEIKDIFKTYKKTIQISEVNYEKIGLKIEERLREMNYSLWEFATKLEIRPTLLGRIIRGETKVNLDILVKICKGLEISIEEVLGQEVKKGN